MFDLAGAWDEGLDDAQVAAATHGDGPLIVMAGAGTGKTRALTARVAWLLERGIGAERILLLTFTRRAAAEMLRRVEGLIRHLQPEAIDCIRVHRQLDFGAFNEFPFGEGVAAELVGFIFDGAEANGISGK